MNLKSNEVVREEFIEFEDEAQKGIVYIEKRIGDYFEIGSQLISVPTKELQGHDSFEIHKNELLALADWIQKNVK